VRVLSSTGDDLTSTDDHFKVAMRQTGAFAQLEKARLVSKLNRKRQEAGWCEGRKTRIEQAQKGCAAPIL
jgi:hypothetical protein